MKIETEYTYQALEEMVSALEYLKLHGFVPFSEHRKILERIHKKFKKNGVMPQMPSQWDKPSFLPDVEDENGEQ